MEPESLFRNRYGSGSNIIPTQNCLICNPICKIFENTYRLCFFLAKFIELILGELVNSLNVVPLHRIPMLSSPLENSGTWVYIHAFGAVTPVGSRFAPKPILIFWLYFQNPHENSRFAPKTHIKTPRLPLKPSCMFGSTILKQKSWDDHCLEMSRMLESENTKRLFTTFQGLEFKT